jgi:hypothetical protein
MTISLVWWGHLTKSEKAREVDSIDFGHTSSKKTLQQVWLGDTLLLQMAFSLEQSVYPTTTSLAASTLIILFLEIF